LSCAVALGAVASARGATSAPGLQELLARPVSPGTLALLLPHAAEPLVQERWAEALRDPRAPVRATASRLVHVRGVRPLVPALQQAFAAEADPDAAAEMARALLALAGDEAVEGVVAAVARRAVGVEEAAAMLARARGRAALVSLPALRAAGLPDAALVDFLKRAARGQAGVLVPLGSAAIRNRDAALWRALLAATRTRLGVPSLPLTLPPGLLVAALREPALREVTLWHLVMLDGAGAPSDRESRIPAGSASLRVEVRGGAAAPMPELVRTALDELRGEIESAQAPAPSLAWELVQRSLGREARENVERARHLRAEEPLMAATLSTLAAARRLTDAEREALGLEKADRKGKGGKGGKGEAFDPTVFDFIHGETVVRTLSKLPPGLGEDLLEVTGCKTKGRDEMAAAHVTYGPDGRAREVRVLDEDLPELCRPVARTLLAADLADPADLAVYGSVQTVMVVPDPDVFACQAARIPGLERRCSEDAGECAPVVGRRITEPRKTRGVAPRYPESLQHQRRAGVVVLQATLAPSGCISGVQVRHGVHPRLDLESMLAVSKWRYTPALLDGVAVPVDMYVTVNFMPSN
jgi:TonB family protein